jgi:glycosyltransferase involved in cell wall biosynthesis
MSGPNHAVVAVSEHIARFVRSVGLWPGTPLVTIHNGLDVQATDRAADADEIAALRAELVPDGGQLIGAAGRLEPEKGFDRLIEAMPRVLAELPNARLVILGEGSRRVDLQGKIDQLGVAGRVRLMGARTDLIAMMHAFDLFVLSSRAEPFGLVLLEAMAARRAVLATCVGGVPEVVVPGETGDLVAPEDSLALAEGILALLADTERAHWYGENGRRRVEENFPIERMLTATEQLYRRGSEPNTRSADGTGSRAGPVATRN